MSNKGVINKAKCWYIFNGKLEIYMLKGTYKVIGTWESENGAIDQKI